MTLEDGSEQRLTLNASDVEAAAWQGVDGRENVGVVARLPAPPLGRHVLRLDDDAATCRLTVAPPRLSPVFAAMWSRFRRHIAKEPSRPAKNRERV